MRVLLAHNYYRSSAPSGEDTVFRNEHTLLLDYGVDVIPYERFNDTIDTSSLAERTRLALRTAWSKDTYESVRDLIRETNPDIAHFHNTFPQISPSAYAACRDSGVPVVQTLHNFRLICPGGLLLRDGQPCEDCVGTSLLPALRHRCYRKSLPATGVLVWMLMRNRWHGTYQNLVNRYIALTQFAADRLVTGGLPKDRISIKPNFSPSVSSLGKRDGGYAVYVGRLSEEKGLRTLISAWRLIPDIPLKILGDGPLREELVTVSRRNNLPIDFLGYCSRSTVLETVRRAVLQVIPSECYEGFPMAILDAYACGIPVVCSRIGSLNEIVQEGKTGIKYKAGDAADLAQNVKVLFGDPARLSTISEEARSEFLVRYTPDRNFRLLMSIYHHTLGEHANKRISTVYT